ncbi:adenylate cyclase 3 (plasmid) [Rhizobium favelukesii]|uniref:Adenylate cyclase 3 n=1 Tax=Rhizobium favelukesii TaxID=348824 RepID=W6S4U6_9HYPH|nr:adenylate cyclase 3 [Rhizobium favelukesii]
MDGVRTWRERVGWVWSGPKRTHTASENSSPAQLGALALAYLGERDRAKEWAARTLAIDPDDLNGMYNIACAYLHMGEHEAALDLLRRSFR